MGKNKIAVYAICKNEEKFVDRWIDSMSEADEIYVTDTGSEDNTVERLRARGAHVQIEKLEKWRFDTARNISLDFVPRDIDICVCTDLDEIFEPGWRSCIEESWKENTTRLKYMYTWRFNPDGTPGVTFWYEKIHSRHGFKWIYPVHEILEYNGKLPDSYAVDGRIRLGHYPDLTKSRGQYLSLLELSVKEDPENDRNMHYLGREYLTYRMWDKCIETLKRHLLMKSAWWKDERCASMRYIAKAYIGKDSLDKAEGWLYRAVAEAPYLREPYIEAALLAYARQKWHIVYAMSVEALKIKERPKTYINEAYSWDHTPYDLAALGAYYMGIYEKALEYAEKALSISPTNERLKKNLEIIKDHTRKPS